MKTQVIIITENPSEDYWVGTVVNGYSKLPFHATANSIAIGGSNYKWPKAVHGDVIKAVKHCMKLYNKKQE